jgi:hypothetical protein
VTGLLAQKSREFFSEFLGLSERQKRANNGLRFEKLGRCDDKIDARIDFALRETGRSTG